MPHDHPDHDHDHSHAPHEVPTHTHTPRAAPRTHAQLRADAARGRQRVELARGAGIGKLLFLDAFSGIAGDMLVAALVDLGVPEQALREPLSRLAILGYELRFETRIRHGIAGLGLEVLVHAPQPSRSYAAIRALLDGECGLTVGALSFAKHAFAVLAQAEADVHGTTIDDVHFHEVGAVDSVVDILAAAIAIDYLGARVICSPLPMGRGFVRAQHGVLPLPAPATLACLSGVPTYDAGIDGELVTPTGACLVRTFAESFSRWPSLSTERVGWGAGSRELTDRPNLLRVVLGSIPAETSAGATHRVLELNLDDLSGELVAIAMAAAFEAGALDVWTTPIGMKKGRPALMLSALATAGATHAVAHALLRESSSLGLRMRDVTRIERPRRMVSVPTEYGPIAVKVADGDGLPPLASPEHEACRLAALAHGVPVREVYAAAISAYRQAQPGAHRNGDAV